MPPSHTRLEDTVARQVPVQEVLMRWPWDMHNAHFTALISVVVRTAVQPMRGSMMLPTEYEQNAPRGLVLLDARFHTFTSAVA